MDGEAQLQWFIDLVAARIRMDGSWTMEECQRSLRRTIQDMRGTVAPTGVH